MKAIATSKTAIAFLHRRLKILHFIETELLHDRSVWFLGIRQVLFSFIAAGITIAMFESFRVLDGH
jgi:hypothetical protein